ncbi:hypothetical protein HS99_0022760 [Kitasatospora aureofaciens]|uniref:Major facilitator superfamily (MFS) profile domain-containing protein n=1 Tax=Kitasatospora aureofaciens TaxID=1894 RepID=A0A1E7NC30_KITAU|nr:hypothetical protein B6264_13350 [Kitasatospora aureofaciens]OEV38033.1 hypothetical protein HS99_0022760 [Kitasatospora aureofaciens]
MGAAVGGGVPSAALAAGLGSAVCGTLYSTTVQHWVPPELLGRLSAFGAVGSFAVGPLGLAAAGPLSARYGTGGVLLVGAVWQVAAGAVVLGLPAVRDRRWEEGPDR